MCVSKIQGPSICAQGSLLQPFLFLSLLLPPIRLTSRDKSKSWDGQDENFLQVPSFHLPATATASAIYRLPACLAVFENAENSRRTGFIFERNSFLFLFPPFSPFWLPLQRSFVDTVDRPHHSHVSVQDYVQGRRQGGAAGRVGDKAMSKYGKDGRRLRETDPALDIQDGTIRTDGVGPLISTGLIHGLSGLCPGVSRSPRQ